MTIPQYKKALCSMFVMSLCVNAGWSQVKVGSSPYGMSAFPGDTWPKSARTLSLGYFNIMGDQFDADISANPALGADVDGIYLAAGYYYDPFAEPSYLLYFGYRETDYLALLTVGRKFSNQVSLVFNSAIFIRHFQYLAGSPYFFYLQRYEEMSKSYSASLGYKLQEEIILGLKVNYSNYDLENVSNNSGISSDIINFDIGIEVRNLANKQKTTRPDNPEKFYSRWRNKRVTGINIAMALKNIGKQHENSSIQAINSPLDLCFGTSWLAINSEAFGVEFLANYKRDLR
ncbi:MAG TPA: hypothetical protein VHP63_07115, partial [candidate division Zixibacteria bacterium]|nr:hypothetical protein [candidate division Zixibacteria bacterium]